MKEFDISRFRRHVYEKHKDKKLTITKNANLIGISFHSYWNLLNNRCNPELLTVIRVCDYFSLRITDYIKEKL